MSLPNERDYHATDALAVAYRALRRLNFSAKFTNFSLEPSTYFCELSQQNGSRASIGMGKGSAEEAKTGSVFEAIEHYLSSLKAITKQNIRVMPAHSLKAIDTNGDPLLSIVVSQDSAQVACFEYKKLVAPTNSLSLPVFLSVPDFISEPAQTLRAQIGDNLDYRDIFNHASNSGTAIGSNTAEALVHAINELVERDSFSLFLLRSFFSGKRLLPLDPGTFPPKLMDLFKKTVASLPGPVYLFEMKNQFHIPCFLAWTPQTYRDESPLIGLGCSLNVEYAAHRAITELMQVSVNPTIEYQKDYDQQAHEWCLELDAFGPRNNLKRCACVKLEDVLAPGEQVHFPLHYENPKLTSSLEHLSHLAGILLKNGFDVYYREHSSSRSLGLSCVHVVIPKLERFFMITLGKPIVPSLRGREYLRSQGAIL